MRQVALLGAAILLGLAGAARAVEYELPIDIDNEDDLYELLASEEISEESFNTLVEILRRGIDLNSADAEEIYALPGLTLKDAEAIVAYRVAAGGITDPGGLVAAGVLAPEKLISIAPFLIVGRPTGPTVAASGRARYRATVTASDSRLPAMALEGRFQALGTMTGGLDLLVTRNSLADVRYDPTRDALSAQPREMRPELAKIYFLWRIPSFEIIAGNFHAGFGQRLTFDVSPLYTPNGLYIDDSVYRSTDLVSSCIESSGETGVTPCPSDPRRYVTPDYRARPGLFGLGVRARKLPLGAYWLEMTAFISRELHDIYQYELYDAGKCMDPDNDDAPECKAPPVYRREDDLLRPTTTFKFVTLPDMWAELLGGGNVSLFTGRRSHVGATAWGARPSWLTDGIDLSFQEWSSFPRGGAYGAAGADAAWGRDWIDLAVEGARTFDGLDGGDLGVVARATATTHKTETELVLRWYGENFLNPHTGAVAEPDEAEGQRARDEAGVRARFAGKVTPRISLRGLVDVWQQPSTSITKLRAEGRFDYLFARYFTGTVYTRFNDKDLAKGGTGQCYETTFLETVDGEPIPCAGQKFDLGLIIKWSPLRRMTLGGQVQGRLVDDRRYMDKPRTDVAAVASMNWWPSSAVRLHGRIRYDRPDVEGGIAKDAYLEESVWTYFDASYHIPRFFEVGARYELRVYLNEDQRSYAREPSPEHWFQVEVEAKF